jgi:UDP-N-acetylmuramate dehydrogenase
VITPLGDSVEKSATHQVHLILVLYRMALPIPNFSLRQFNTFGLQVSCRHYLPFHSAEELTASLALEDVIKSPKMILGGGSNVLFLSDYPGIILHNQIQYIREISREEDTVWIQAGAGTVWNDLVNYCVEKEYYGIENLALIPGTCGAAPIQNIGAYGTELKSVLYSLEVFNFESKEIEIFTNADCQFGYRNSFFKLSGKGKYCIVSITLKLSTLPVLNLTYMALKDELEKSGISQPTIQDVRDTVVKIRSSKLPNPAEIGNAGSFFKNPEITEGDFRVLQQNHPDLVSYASKPGYRKLAAGWLIEKAGWKGYRTGDVGVHERQALVLVNYGNGKGIEIAELAEKIQDSVFAHFDIRLEPEVNFIG